MAVCNLTETLGIDFSIKSTKPRKYFRSTLPSMVIRLIEGVPSQLLTGEKKNKTELAETKVSYSPVALYFLT